jgi:hypothetical protein
MCILIIQYTHSTGQGRRLQAIIGAVIIGGGSLRGGWGGRDLVHKWPQADAAGAGLYKMVQ